MAIVAHPMRAAAMDRLLKDVLGYPRDETIMRDQHDPMTQPSLQGQQVTRRLPSPSGRSRCAVCARLSETFMLWPVCRSCSEEVCPEHQAPGTLDDEAWGCLCTTCAVPALTTPPDSVLIDQVAHVLVRALGTSQPFDELVPAERERIRAVARMAVALCHAEAERVARWIAAEQLIRERTQKHEWRTASSRDRALAWGDAGSVLTTVRQQLLGVLPAEWTGRARLALADMAKKPGQTSAFLEGAK